MKWIKNLESFAQTRIVGNCPHCNSMRTKYAFKRNSDTSSVGYGVFWCEECLKAYHLSRVEVTPDMLTENTLPSGLIFTN